MRPGLPALAALVCLSAIPASVTSARDRVASEVYDLLNSLRADMELSPLERDGTLDRVARARAELIAEAPPGRRLAVPGSVTRMVREAGLLRYRKLAHRIDLLSGYVRPGPVVVARWLESPEAWSEVQDPRATSIGLAAVGATDDTVVFVAIVLQDAEPLPDPHELERETVRRVNDIRARHGLARLAPSKRLGEVARGHSADMAQRDYFAHESPEGRTVGDRARSRGIGYRTVAENISRIQGADDPVAPAVEGWMDSPGHRRNILDPDVVETGVGVAIDDEGGVYFTQMFLEPG